MPGADRYEPPRAPLESAALLPQGFRIGAVLAGLLTDFGLSLLFGIAVTSAIAASLLERGLSPDALAARVAEASLSAPWIWASLASGTLATLAGGYVAGRYAPSAPVRHALFVAAAGILLGASCEALGAETTSPLYRALGYGLAFPAAAAGGWLAGGRAR